MPKFDQAIEARVPDPECEGWDVLHLACGHLSHAPANTTNRQEHCGVCRLNHEAHERGLKQLQNQIAKAAGAAGTPTV